MQGHIELVLGKQMSQQGLWETLGVVMSERARLLWEDVIGLLEMNEAC